MVVGLGDLGSRIFNSLMRSRRIERVVGASRDVERGQSLALQGALIACLSNGPRYVTFQHADLENREMVAALLQEIDPDVVVITASFHTWWRPLTSTPGRAAQLASLPYGAWLPLHVPLVRSLMEAQQVVCKHTRVVSLPYPDAVGPVLAPLGLAPHIGAGNITEVAAKLAVLAGAKSHQSGATQVRLVMHHAAERQAFAAFAALDGLLERNRDLPPWIASVHADGASLPPADVEELFYRPYPLPPGRDTHDLTAAATVHLVHAMLGDEPSSTHAPAPHGLPGGYSIQVSRHSLTLDLPPNLQEEQAIAINEDAARWDGIERIEPDGTVVFTPAVASATASILNIRLDRIRPSEHLEVAQEMLAHVRG